MLKGGGSIRWFTGREPFEYDCDSVSFQDFVVTVKKGFLWQRNVVEKVQ